MKHLLLGIFSLCMAAAGCQSEVEVSVGCHEGISRNGHGRMMGCQIDVKGLEESNQNRIR